MRFEPMSCLELLMFGVRKTLIEDEDMGVNIPNISCIWNAGEIFNTR